MVDVKKQTEAIVKWLRIFVEQDQFTELRALGVPGGTLSRCFQGTDLEAMATLAVQCEQDGARGVYFTPNPLKGLTLSGKGNSAMDCDVLARRWVLIDIDPVRDPVDQASTRAERSAAWEALTRVRSALETAAFPTPVVGDSGNGWHLCYPSEQGNIDVSRDLVKRLLGGLQKRCGNDRVKIDPAVCNAARIWKLYGTLARKGENTPERPWRYSKVIEGV